MLKSVKTVIKSKIIVLIKKEFLKAFLLWILALKFLKRSPFKDLIWLSISLSNPKYEIDFPKRVKIKENQTF